MSLQNKYNLHVIFNTNRKQYGKVKLFKSFSSIGSAIHKHTKIHIKFSLFAPRRKFYSILLFDKEVKIKKKKCTQFSYNFLIYWYVFRKDDFEFFCTKKWIRFLCGFVLLSLSLCVCVKTDLSEPLSIHTTYTYMNIIQTI